ncbi:DUF6232 family protein [Dactylosporangium sp. NPDC051541]|uniref:DUF6232 family protein n=1 Tax=Dactylosporangium sp. NPDC051541 TaxID=3363977 RepID=UPI00379F3FE9
MAVNAEKPGPTRVVYYPGPRVVVTSDYIESAEGYHRISDLDDIDRVSTYAYPTSQMALFTGIIEVLLGAGVAAVSGGSLALVGSGLFAGASMAAAVIHDGHRNPRWMALRAIANGREFLLFQSRNQAEFEAVRRAVIRAVEANREPRL